MAGTESYIVPVQELHSFVVRCMETAGACREHAGVLADLLVAADYRGHYSHGLNRLDMYVRDVRAGSCAGGPGEPKILKEKAGTALVDGNNLLGPPVGRFCMDLALKKAREVGVGWVSVRGSNHFGIAGWYSMRAADQGLIGMAYTNTSPIIAPTRSKERFLGTNPIAMAAPGNGGEMFALDMATSAVALGKAELADRKGQSIPRGWGMDADGKSTTDGGLVVREGALLPLGGEEETSGYKGSGLSMMVDIFCSILSGSASSGNVRSWQTSSEPANLGQCFVALDPEAFEPGFADRVTELLHKYRGLTKADGESEILVAGDPERKHMKECDDLGGIPYHPNQITYADDLAKECGIDAMKREHTDG